MTEWRDTLDLREMLQRIDQRRADTERKYQLIQWEPWKVAFAGMTAGAAILTAGVVIGGFLVKLLHL